MKHYRSLFKNFVLAFFLLTLMVGCKKIDDELKGYDKIVGTATINGQNYKETVRWAWNYKGYPSSINLFENYNLFYFIVRLFPENGNNPLYSINFYVSEDQMQLKTNHPYKIDLHKELDAKSLEWWHVVPYFSENKSKVLSEGADGIAYAFTSDSDEAIPLKGEFIIERINDSIFHSVYGSYSLSSSENDSDKLKINGKFETTYYLLESYF